MQQTPLRMLDLGLRNVYSPNYNQQQQRANVGPFCNPNSLPPDHISSPAFAFDPCGYRRYPLPFVGNQKTNAFPTPSVDYPVGELLPNQLRSLNLPPFIPLAADPLVQLKASVPTYQPKHQRRRRSLVKWVRDAFNCCLPIANASVDWRVQHLRRIKAMRKSNFSKRFLAETNLAITGSRLDLNLLVKDTGNGVLSTGSVESLELESLQRRLKKWDFDEVRADNRTMYQARLVDCSRGDGGAGFQGPVFFEPPFAGSNWNNSRQKTPLSRSTPCLVSLLESREQNQTPASMELLKTHSSPSSPRFFLESSNT
uniref:Uncharacterized protein n=1 Tax=Schistocephalus solidus TaxID=70667 RepID=A0A0X3PE95_SCHSO